MISAFGQALYIDCVVIKMRCVFPLAGNDQLYLIGLAGCAATDRGWRGLLHSSIS